MYVSALLTLMLLARTPTPIQGLGSSPRALDSLVEVVPEEATDLIFSEPAGAKMDVALRALARAIGPFGTAMFLASAPLPALMLKAMEPGGGTLGFNPAGGLGLFHLPNWRGAVGVASISSEGAALASLKSYFLSGGATQIDDSPLPLALRLPERGSVFSFCHRGYLFLIIPEEEENEEVIRRLVDRIRSAKGDSLRANALWQKLTKAVPGPETVSLFMRQPIPELGAIQGALVKAVAKDDSVDFAGYLASFIPLRPPPRRAAKRSLLRNAPARPMFSIGMWLERELLSQLLFFEPEEGETEQSSPVDLWEEALATALDGRLDVLLYVDENARDTELLPAVPSIPLSAAMVEGTIADSSAMKRYVEVLLERLQPHRLRQTRSDKVSTYRGSVDELPFELRVSDKLINAKLGRLGKRKFVNWESAMQKKFGGDAFGPGHVSMFVDVAEMRRQLFEMGGVEIDAMDDPMAIQWGDVEYIFGDVAPDEGGARFRGKIQFSSTGPQSSTARH